jgi:hypothetical protein
MGGCQLCPLIVTNKTVTVPRVQQLAATIVFPILLQPFATQTSYLYPPIGQPAFLHAPTLLSLGCAFTV